MKKLTILLLVSACWLWAKPVDLQMGARAFGMGGAFVAIANDATTTYWNPAGLAQINDITFSETNWLLTDVEGVNVNYLDAVFPIKGIGTIAGGWLLQHALLEEKNGGEVRENTWNESSFSLAAGRELWNKLWIFERTSVGFSLNRHVITTSTDANGAGLGFDLGLWTAFPYGISLAMVARSIATDMMGDKISPEYKVGLGYTFIHPMHRVTVAADVASKQDVEYEEGVQGADVFLGSNYKWFGGLEYCFMYQDWWVGLRGGANRMFVSERGNTVITAGGGFGYGGMDLNYAWQTNTEDEFSLGMTHRISFELRLQSLMNVINGKKKEPSSLIFDEPAKDKSDESESSDDVTLTPAKSILDE
ncbi:MAG: hypothetical protein HQK83_10235 [Fibrobacteria bacterium]|nr:hypothetical protein [Fibrobacteria bacterium]